MFSNYNHFNKIFQIESLEMLVMQRKVGKKRVSVIKTAQNTAFERFDHSYYSYDTCLIFADINTNYDLNGLKRAIL